MEPEANDEVRLQVAEATRAVIGWGCAELVEVSFHLSLVQKYMIAGR